MAVICRAKMTPVRQILSHVSHDKRLRTLDPEEDARNHTWTGVISRRNAQGAHTRTVRSKHGVKSGSSEYQVLSQSYFYQNKQMVVS